MDVRDALERGPVALIVDPVLSAINRDSPVHTAGVTFVGQFMDHDMTFDASSQLGQATLPGRAQNSRSPSFDLDSVDGRGPVYSVLPSMRLRPCATMKGSKPSRRKPRSTSMVAMVV